MSRSTRHLGAYRILGHAGQGAMGVVYVAAAPGDGRRVAVKVCPIDAGADARALKLARKLFFNEAHTASALSHPHILRVLDAGEHQGQPFIVMEYVEGGRTLKDHVQPETLLAPGDAARAVYQCACALDHAHGRGVIHRDVKPGNIMLTADGDAKIGDFGIAHYAFSDATQVMGMLGSPRYMSPEQAREEELTPATDLYSLGVVLYELLTGAPPFAARGIARLVMKILNEDPPPPTSHQPGLGAATDALLARALAKDPGARFASGRDFATAIAAVFDDAAPAPGQHDAEGSFATARALRFFADFNDAELREVIDASAWLRCPDGTEVISEGRLEDTFYVIADGEVSVSRQGHELCRLGTGDCFGEMGYLAQRPRSAAITACGEVHLMRVAAARMEQASVHCRLRFDRVFLRTLIERLDHADTLLARRH